MKKIALSAVVLGTIVAVILSIVLPVSSYGIDPELLAAAQQKVDMLRREAEASPGDPRTHLELAALLHNLDHHLPDGGSRVEEAERSYRAALALLQETEQKAMLLQSLGALQMGAGRAGDAISTIEQGIRLLEGEGGVGQTQEGSGGRGGAKARSNAYSGLLFDKGKALEQAGDLAGADSSYRAAMAAARAARRAPTWAKAAAALERPTQQEAAEWEQAAEYLALKDAQAGGGKLPKSKRRVMESLAGSWSWLAAAGGGGGGGGGGLEPTQRSYLHFALYRMYDERGDTKRAFQHLATANQLQQRGADTAHSDGGGGGLPGPTRQSLEVLRQVYDRAVDPQGSEPYDRLLSGSEGHPDPMPIFIVGMPRSGSTLLEQVLASHPQVHGAGEDSPLAQLMPRLQSAVAEYEQRGGVGGSGIADAGREYVEALRARVPEQRQAAVTRVVDKMLLNSWHVAHIATALPNACILQAERHPLDVALSCYSTPFEGRGDLAGVSSGSGSIFPWASDLDTIADTVQLTSDLMALWNQTLPPGRILQVRYEDLVRDLEGTMRRVLQHCGLPWDDAVLRFYQQRSMDGSPAAQGGSGDGRAVQTASATQVRKPLYSTSMGRWVRYKQYLVRASLQLQGLIERYEREARLTFEEVDKGSEEEEERSINWADEL